ncbi:MAG: glycoside hydrolase family 9 protein [Oscillospiraceae bacterium]|nr:glycoside hydrolase family 9 protein [Oscillospiraceae bacterium]
MKSRIISIISALLAVVITITAIPTVAIAQPPAAPDIRLQTIFVNPPEWQGGGTVWTTESWGGANLVPNSNWTTLTIADYYENGVLEFDVRHMGAGNQSFQIGLRSNRHGVQTTINWNTVTAGRTLVASPEWQSFSLSIKALVDANPNPVFNLNDLWYIAVGGVGSSGMQFRDVRISSPDDERQFPFVKLNQVGYEVGRPKTARVSYFAKFGALPAEQVFQVINAATGEVAHSGVLPAAIADPVVSGEMLHTFSFDELDTPGEYFIRIPNTGLNPAVRSPRDVALGLSVATIESVRFTIARNVYEELIVDLSRYFYFQRQGLDLEAKYAGDFARANLHPNDATVRLWSDRNNPNPAPHNVYDLTKGWYDAGDYGKYVLPTAGTLSDMLWAYELYPEVFANLDLNIPETDPANPLYSQLPGILSEIKWALDMLLAFEHHSKDGSFFAAANYCNENNVIWLEDTRTRGTTHTSPASERDLRSHTATAGAAAVLAHAYVVFNSIPEFEGYAAELLLTALRAWGWLTNPENAQNRRIDAANRVYSFTQHELNQEMFWAAGALYRATGNAVYETYLTEAFSAAVANVSQPGYDVENCILRPFTVWNALNYNHGGRAFLGYVHYLYGNTNPNAAIRDRFVSTENGFPKWRADMVQYNSNNWGITYPNWGYWWGSNQMIAQNSLMFLLGSVIVEGLSDIPDSVITHMENTAHHLLGMNAISFSYVSGHGTHSVSNIFSAIFSSDARLTPYRTPPGYFTEGSNIYDNRHLSRFDGKCYVDSDAEWTTNENTIYGNAAMLFLMAAIAANTVSDCSDCGICEVCTYVPPPVVVITHSASAETCQICGVEKAWRVTTLSVNGVVTVQRRAAKRNSDGDLLVSCAGSHEWRNF